MDERERYIVREGKRLRLGYTTGSCAAAAAKAAAYMLLTGRRTESVTLDTPRGITLRLPVREIETSEHTVCCAIEKDPGDDPDVTRGVLVFAAVSLADTPGIAIDGGEGVGRVTKPGLDQPVGAAAINSVPRRMIEENVREVCLRAGYTGGLSVVISVPAGAALAEQTFNPRLGIQGGISILGTTGIVEPMSQQALTDTIRVELRQRRAGGADFALLTPGNYGAAYIRDGLGLDPTLAVQTSNFIGDALDCCRELGFQGALLVGHVGKLVKLAGGMWNTHSKYGDCRMELLAAHAGAAGLSSAGCAAVLDCVSCDEALRVIGEAGGEGLREETLRRVTARIAAQLKSRAGEAFAAGAILFSRSMGFLSATENAGALLDRISGADCAEDCADCAEDYNMHKTPRQSDAPVPHSGFQALPVG